jgi:hypothetical protein
MDIKNFIEKPERRYLSLALLGTIVLYFLINYKLANDYISSLNPIAQFMILNLGVYLIFFFLFKGIALKSKHIWKNVLGTMLLFIGVDLILPEYHVNSTGLIAGGIFGKSASDYFFGYIYQTYFHIPIWILSFMVYIVTSMGLLFIASLLLKNFVKNKL